MQAARELDLLQHLSISLFHDRTFSFRPTPSIRTSTCKTFFDLRDKTGMAGWMKVAMVMNFEP